MLSTDINEVTLADLYGPSYGSTVGELATNATGRSSILANPGQVSETMVPGNAGGAVLGHPLLWWGVAAAGVLGLWFLFEHVGPAEERRNFSNIELSAVNVLLLSLVPLVGLPVWKTVFAAGPFPSGVKSFVAAA